MLNILLQLVTYRIPSALTAKGKGINKPFISFISFDADESDNALKSVTMIPVPGETHTRILSDTTCWWLSI
jgi:hypothetical protein